MQIHGATILLTGASGGLGRATAVELASRGARLVVTARNRDALAEIAERTGAEVVVADLSDPDDTARLAEVAAGVDVLVANAGTGGDVPFDAMTPDDVDRMIGVNLRAPIVLSAALGHAAIADNRPAQIVFVGSLSGMVASPDTRLYNATKFGLRGYSLALRQDLGDRGVGVSLVAPGFIRDAGMFAESGMQLPSGVRTRSPEDVAKAVVRAIEHNPAEVFVAPPELRLSATVATAAPAVSEWIQRRVGAADIKAGR